MEAYEPLLMFDAQGPATTVQLFISCRKLKNLDLMSKSDPFCEVFMKNDSRSQWLKVGQTDTVNNSLNPDFAVPITINYYFEKNQEIRFEVYDDDGSSREEQGKVTCKVGSLVGAKNQTYVADLLDKSGRGDRGQIIVKSDSVKGSNKICKMTIRCYNLISKKKCFCLEANNPFLIIKR